MQRTLFEPEHTMFRETVRAFVDRHVTPHQARWDDAGIVDRDVYVEAAKAGVIGFNVPECYGGGGVTDDFRYNAVVGEELACASATGPAFVLQNDVIAPYLTALTTNEQRSRWLPAFARGELVAALAMTEPGAGSDLQGITTRAVRDGDDFVLTGAKTFISCGIHADLVIVVARTDPEAGASKAFTLFAVDRGSPGFTHGRNLKKIGLHAQDTAELYFDQVRIPRRNVIGPVGGAFGQLMRNLAMERLSIAIAAIATSRQVLDVTVDYARERTAFGRPIGSFQSNTFTLVEAATEIDIAQAYVDSCIESMNTAGLDPVDAAKAKWWSSEMAQRVVYNCQQLWGGYGYMQESPVARAYTDVRIHTIFGGTTQVMKQIIGRSLGF